MPRTVLLSLVLVVSLGVIAAGALPFAASELAGRTGFSLASQAITVAALAFFAASTAWTARGLARREERARRAAFAVALTTALLFGGFALPMGVIAAVQAHAGLRDALIVVAASLVAIATPAAVAWLLSRPSAKAWCAPLAART